MHIPDGFLSTTVIATTYAASAATGALASKMVKKEVSEEKIPLLGVAAAFIFAAQMVNFPVAGGTSGHLVGGLLAALIAGPFSGFFIMTSVLVVQALLFGDGGITALGANILNMAVIGSLLTYYLFSAISKLVRSRKISIALSAWLSIVLSAIACSVELVLSGKAQPGVLLPAMVSIHMLIGIGEAIITLGIVEAIASFRPDLLRFSAKEVA